MLPTVHCVLPGGHAFLDGALLGLSPVSFRLVGWAPCRPRCCAYLSYPPLPPADEFHLGTLQALLGALPQLQPGVRVHSVLSLLMDRLAK